MQTQIKYGKFIDIISSKGTFSTLNNNLYKTIKHNLKQHLDSSRLVAIYVMRVDSGHYQNDVFSKFTVGDHSCKFNVGYSSLPKEN